MSLREEGSDYPVGGRPQRRRRCNLYAGIDARGSAVNGRESARAIQWSLALQVGESSLEILVKPRRQDQGGLLTIHAYLLSSVDQGL